MKLINFKGKPKILKKFELDFQAQQSFMVKNVSWDCALKNIPKEFLPVLNEMKNHLKNKHKYITVDFKIHYLRKGEYPCIPGWHLDTNMDVKKDNWENHLLFVLGENSLTEFLNQDIELTYSNKKKQTEIKKDYQNQIKKLKINPWKIPEQTIVQYSRDSFHRGSSAISDGWRVLIRVSEQSLFIPKKIWNKNNSNVF